METAILPLVLTLILLGLILYLSGWVSIRNTGRVAGWLRKGSGVLLVFGVALIVTRNIGVAIFSAMLAYSALSRMGWITGGGGTVSTVRTSYIEMSLDHATGMMSGRVIKGRFSGRALSDFTARERTELLSELRSADQRGAQLLEAYLDRTSPGWNGGGASGRSGVAGSKAMSVEEAYLVLGLNPGATRDDVQASHRNLMKRFHPDQGGSTYLAAQVNQAKDILLRHIRA